jgi:hypothetical protein
MYWYTFDIKRLDLTFPIQHDQEDERLAVPMVNYSRDISKVLLVLSYPYTDIKGDVTAAINDWDYSRCLAPWPLIAAKAEFFDSQLIFAWIDRHITTWQFWSPLICN